MAATQGITLDLPVAERRQVRISLTPLIDVVFILLVFFMLASSYIDWRVIGLGTGGSGSAAAESQTPVVLRLSTDGSLQAGDAQLRLDQAAAHVRAASSGEAVPPVVLMPDPGVDLQAAIRVLDALAADGIERLSLAQSAGGP